jgi:hypothetical protein
MPKKLTDSYKFIVSDYTRFADEGQKFLRFIVTADKTEVNHTTLETKQAYTMLKNYHLYRQNIQSITISEEHCGNYYSGQ